MMCEDELEKQKSIHEILKFIVPPEEFTNLNIRRNKNIQRTRRRGN